jgi:hypothetical protein
MLPSYADVIASEAAKLKARDNVAIMFGHRVTSIETAPGLHDPAPCEECVYVRRAYKACQ